MENLFKKNNLFLISIGAVPAAIFRWQIDKIWIVNIVGCFLLGFINSLPIPRKYKLVFGFSFCGSLTSYSGWSLKLFELISHGFYKLFFLNSILAVLIGCFAFAFGHLLAKHF
ncbi:fluoride efflux transporter FluC [Prochlorococcus sp. MIT 0916]|uniref:Fluoride-specific ion channel FluC n=1 Tax=Prochlorococcus marinus str. P0903-H212 TaxID=1622208 RepID=A0A0D5A3Z8_PROMR|nr:CrcB protein [Prochlorococcus marinus str. P0903-H212]